VRSLVYGRRLALLPLRFRFLFFLFLFCSFSCSANRGGKLFSILSSSSSSYTSHALFFPRFQAANLSSSSSRVGLEVRTWSALPKGSGLGTSSILAVCVLEAVARVLNRVYSKESLIHAVLMVRSPSLFFRSYCSPSSSPSSTSSLVRSSKC
jgi:hypothetical protein